MNDLSASKMIDRNATMKLFAWLQWHHSQEHLAASVEF
jgi:hypothetical protein